MNGHHSGGTRAELADLVASLADLLKQISATLSHGTFAHNAYLPCKVRGITRHFTADYVIGPTGKPNAVIQKVLLNRSQSVHSNAFMFDSLMSAEISPVKKENCLAVVDGSHATTEEAKEGLQLLQQMVTVVDVAQHAIAQAVLADTVRRAIPEPSDN